MCRDFSYEFIFMLLGVFYMFENERKMQNWLSEELDKCDGLSDLIANYEYLEGFEPRSFVESVLYESFNNCFSSLGINKVLSEDENISLKKGDSLKPDFLMFAPEVEGIVIVELKNNSGPTREVGTELGAYSEEVRAHIPFLSSGDLYHVIVSTSWPTLMRHYIFNEVIWGDKNILCLEPVEIQSVVKLNIVDISKILEGENYKGKISSDNVTGCQVCLYDRGAYKRRDQVVLDNCLPQLEAGLSVMASEGEKQKSSGFAFLWKDSAPYSMASFSISVFNMSPFSELDKISGENKTIDDLSMLQKRFGEVVREQVSLGHGQSLFNIVKPGTMLLESICAPRLEGFLGYDDLCSIMLERGEFIAFKSWGRFAREFNNQLLAEYSNGNHGVSINSPAVGWQVLDRMIQAN